MQVVTFYSYKGGVGRTLALANMARRLADDFSKTVVVMDFDLEATNRFGRLSLRIQ
jgi:MinD-like ATPase involved in chromosome partitioning or flagellar assembly